ncbi:LysR substrate-binding domain-containing protein [Bradyrhizobium sp. 48]|uniref:LysR substrate-binding domain-containing protein n=1 Tax=Bradyrhizobium sp. 48 TaxID=2782676 RepID=UPI00201B994E|nr:LysR substrate-binding domain-containing protein [Bradyrhizobium sp. 48]
MAVHTWRRIGADPDRRPAVSQHGRRCSSGLSCGRGVAMMTYWDVYEQIERGELKRIVLADAAPVELGIWAVFLTRAQMPVRVRAFIDALRKRLLAGTLP